MGGCIVASADHRQHVEGERLENQAGDLLIGIGHVIIDRVLQNCLHLRIQIGVDVQSFFQSFLIEKAHLFQLSQNGVFIMPAGAHDFLI